MFNRPYLPDYKRSKKVKNIIRKRRKFSIKSLLIVP